MSDEIARDRPSPSAAAEQRDYELDDFIAITRSDQLKALGDQLRRRICDLVLERAYSVTELADRLGRPRGTVAYHVDVLVDAGLLHVVRTRRVRALEERFYGRVARTYVLPDGPDGTAALPDLTEAIREVDRSLLDELAPPGSEPIPGSRPAIASFRRARIPAERATDYARRLWELTAEFLDEPRAGDVEFGLCVALFPTARLAHRDDDRSADA
jgi:DNA-binding transcriptional ArsR family regulator